MKEKNDVRLNIKLSPELRKAFKIKCAERELEMSKVVTDFIIKWIAK